MDKTLPKQVELLGKFLKSDRSHDLFEIANLLITDSEEHIEMWRSLENREQFSEDDLWVRIFLGSVHLAVTFPPYYFVSQTDRKNILKRIDYLTNELLSVYEENDLAPRIVAANGKIFNGFYIIDEFSEKNREGFENDENTQKCDFMSILKGVAAYAEKKIKDAGYKGKSGKNAKAIRLIRELSDHTIRKYGTPLNNVLATVANTLYSTSFTESDIRKLLSRVGN